MEGPLLCPEEKSEEGALLHANATSSAPSLWAYPCFLGTFPGS